MTPNRFGVCTDIILFYAASSDAAFTPQYNRDHPSYQEYIEKHFRLVDEHGRRYQADNLANPAYRPNLIYEYKGYPPPRNGWAISRAKMEQWDREGRIHFPKDKSGRLRRKRFVDELKGMPIQNIWDDIGIATGDERVGYPTQKPLALLERIIRASSNEGDVVLDPFCGCATACIAAQGLHREWVGIDISPKAAELVRQRMRDELGMFYQGAHRTDVPIRTDLGKLPKYSSPQNRKRLYGEQGGHCAGCATHFEPRHFDVDHIIARAKGGTDHIENLQLLCGSCNSIKGDRGMDYLRSKLAI